MASDLADQRRSPTLQPPGLSGMLRRMLLVGAVLPILSMLLMTTVLCLQIHQRSIDVDWTEHSDKVLRTAGECLFYLTQMSAIVRDYVIRGDPTSLSSYRKVSGHTADSLSALAFLVRDNPMQSRRVNAISQLKGELIGRYNEIIDDMDHDHCATCAERLSDSRQLIIRIYQDFSQLTGAERDLKRQRQAQQAAGERSIIIGLAALVIVVLAASIYSIWTTVKRVAGIYDQALVDARKSRAVAEQANRAKDEFLGIVSHELRGPLSAISMWTQVLLGGDADDQKIHKGLQAISRAVQSEGQMINDLLDVSRIEAGKMRLDVRTVDLPSVIEAAAEVVRPSAEAKDIRIHVILDPKAGPVVGDPERLQQVSWNLLANAVKFTPKEGRIEVKLERINSHIELTVSDTGRGIDAKVLPRIFEPFWQEERASSRSETGLGLGLSISRKIVEMHGGSLMAASPGPGLGTTFTVILPVSLAHRVSAVPLGVHPTADASNTDGDARLDGLRILAVDDQPDAIAAIQNLLQSQGAEVRTAASARSALAELDSWRPDVLVSDVGMPNEDGYFLIRELRSRSRDQCGDIPAIALTAYGRVQDTVRLLEGGFHMHVTKPVEPAELFAAIRSVTRSTSELNK
jgi:signal transduction histidine kinase/ActR/RegA family two-component response regulator